MTTHKSDCATHNAPDAYPSPCNCGAKVNEIQAWHDATPDFMQGKAHGYITYLLSGIAARDAEIERLRGHMCATPHCAECKAKEDANRRRLEAKP